MRGETGCQLNLPEEGALQGKGLHNRHFQFPLK